MTISSTGTRYSFAGNGATTVFSFPRQFFADADLDVYLVDNATNVATLQVLNTHYTVSGAGSPSGGTVTMLAAPATGKTLVVYRDTPLTQGLDIDNVTALPMSSLEAALDRAMMAIDELATKLGRAMLYPLKGLASTFDWTLPEPVANKVIGINSAGTALELRGPQAWTSGAGAPGAGLGAVGDYYLDTDTGDVYLKTGSVTWTLQANMRGPQGVPGSMTGPVSATVGNIPSFGNIAGSLLNDSGVPLTQLLGYQAVVSAGGTTVLTVASPRFIVVTGSANQTFTLPVVSTLLTGWKTAILNLSSGTVTVNSSGGNAVGTIRQFSEMTFTRNAITGTDATVWHAVYTGGTVSTGFGSLVFHDTATLKGLRLTSANAITAGTNAQGQGAMTQTVNMITTAANNPSGATLPSPSSTSTTSTWLTVINKGANPVNVYPASGHQIDALGSNNPIILPVGGVLTFFSLGTTQWYSSNTGNLVTDASGNAGIGGAPGGIKLNVVGASGSAAFAAGSSTGGGVSVTAFDAAGLYLLGYAAGASPVTVMSIGSQSNIPVSFFMNNGEKARLDTSGNFLITAGGGLGYGPGSGGAVTQLTSKSTGVTLNKPAGQITMNAAALASNTAVVFTLTNSLIAAVDGIVVTIQSPTQKYTGICVGVAAGSCDIRVNNITGGSLSEAVVINYEVIKGANS